MRCERENTVSVSVNLLPGGEETPDTQARPASEKLFPHSVDDWARSNGSSGRTGLFIAVLGPDGAGKSTLIRRLVDVTGTVFRGHQLFHWRPASLWQRKHTGDVTDPHGRAPHSAWWSTARIFSHLLDYWYGYVTRIRPALMNSNLVLFDRYFYDLLVDPRRYRYGGPSWLVSILIPFVPKPDLVLVLDAPEDVVVSRKQELALREARRQRKCYRRLAARLTEAELIATNQDIETVVTEACEAITRVSKIRLSVSQKRASTCPPKLVRQDFQKTHQKQKEYRERS
jgi:thymidylate kinase